jgi:hypothetical protein
MCAHDRACPAPETREASSARVMAPHPEQGWSLLCNGVILFDDGGIILPDGSAHGPGRFRAGARGSS